MGILLLNRQSVASWQGSRLATTPLNKRAPEIGDFSHLPANGSCYIHKEVDINDFLLKQNFQILPEGKPRFLIAVLSA